MHLKFILQFGNYSAENNYFIDNKVQGKIFSWIYDFLEIFLP